MNTLLNFRPLNGDVFYSSPHSISNCKIEGQIIGRIYSAGHKRNLPNSNVCADKSQLVSRAGYLSQFYDGEVVKENFDGFHAVQIFKVLDGSMQPAYKDGDSVICNRVGSISDVCSGEVVIIRTDKQYILKRLFTVDDHILLQCDSEEHNTRRIVPDQIKEVWKVEGKLTLAYLQENDPFADKMEYLKNAMEDLRQQMKILIDRLQDGADSH